MYVFHALLDELDVGLALGANSVFLRGHFALLVDHELLAVSATDADELETALALVDAVEFASWT